MHVSHPRQTLDLLCVADFGTWISGKILFVGPPTLPGWDPSNPEILSRFGPEGSALSMYAQHTFSHERQTGSFTPIGTLISNLSRRLAWENPELRDLVDYYKDTEIGGTGQAPVRPWPISIYSEDVQRSIQGGVSGASSHITTWNEWQMGYNMV